MYHLFKKDNSVSQFFYSLFQPCLWYTMSPCWTSQMWRRCLHTTGERFFCPFFRSPRSLSMTSGPSLPRPCSPTHRHFSRPRRVTRKQVSATPNLIPLWKNLPQLLLQVHIELCFFFFLNCFCFQRYLNFSFYWVSKRKMFAWVRLMTCIFNCYLQLNL